MDYGGPNGPVIIVSYIGSLGLWGTGTYLVIGSSTPDAMKSWNTKLRGMHRRHFNTPSLHQPNPGTKTRRTLYRQLSNATPLPQLNGLGCCRFFREAIVASQ